MQLLRGFATSSTIWETVNTDMHWRPTTPLEVENLCQGLKPFRGAGWDGVSPRVIKAVVEEISGPLSQLHEGRPLPNVF